MMVPQSPLIEGVIVGSGVDAADDWIAEHASPSAIVVTPDILLAERCVKSGATVLAPNGRPFDMASIGQAVAHLALMAYLLEMGDVSCEPPPFSKAVLPSFLSSLHQAVQSITRCRSAPQTRTSDGT